MPVYKTKNEATKSKKTWFFSCYYSTISGEKKKYKSKKYSTKEEAIQAEARFRTSQNIGNISKLTFNHIYNEYIEHHQSNVRIITIEKIRNLYRYIEPLGKIEIKKLNVNTYSKWYNELLENQKLGIPYKNKVLTLLKALIKRAYTFYGVVCNIPDMFGKYKNPNEHKREMQFYTLEEFNIFIGEVTDPIYKSFYTLLFFMGLRQGEAQALTWRDINIKDKILSVNKTLTSKIKGEKYRISPPKTKSSNRVLPIPDIVVTELSNLLLFYKDKPGFNENCFVFGMKNPLPENTIRIKKVFAANKAKIKQIRIHDFRHSCASLLISEGAIITVVAKYLGHSDIKQTLNTYAHMYPSNLYKVVEAFNKLCLKSGILVPN